jgi:hypothetical protein
MTWKTNKNARKMMRDKNLLSNGPFLTAFDRPIVPSFRFYSVTMGVPFGERRKAEVLSMLRNERMHWCCHCGCCQFSALLGARMVTFVTMRKETVN